MPQKTIIPSMRFRFCIAILLLSLLVSGITTSAQTLGNYPNVTVMAGQNTTVTPGAAPTLTTSAVAYTHSRFTGLLSVNPISGAVTVTNAKPAGTYTITVKAFGADTVSKTFTLTVANPPCSQAFFGGNTEVSVGNNPRSVAVGDFNGDGKQDMAVTNTNNGTVSIRLGNGLGGFSGTTNVSVGDGPTSIATGDFNGDGKQDIATGNNTGVIAIRLGDGAGGYSGNTQIIGGNSIALGDFNRDGKQDIASGSSAFGVSISLGDGLGNFTPTGDNIPVENSPASVTVADFNGDGIQDIAVGSSSGNKVSIRLGDGSGGFSGDTEVTVGNNPINVAVADFNGDDKPDIATTSYSSQKVSIRLGNGSGGFINNIDNDVTVGFFLNFIVVGDFNGDSREDFVAGGTNGIFTLTGNGSGGFSSGSGLLVTVPGDPGSAAVGDFNGDGRYDLAITNANSGNTVSIRLGLATAINVQGNSTNIVNGSSTVSQANATDFGISCLGGSIITKTYTIQNTGIIDLSIPSGGITVSGANPSMFTVGGISLPALVGPGSAVTFTVGFSPGSTGVKSAQMNIAYNPCSIPAYTYAVSANVVASTTIGNYPNASIIAGQNITITPGVVPNYNNNMAAFTKTGFSGVFSVNPATGVLEVTNAKPAGTYPVTVTAISSNGCTASTANFTLVVTNPTPTCSQGQFSGSTEVGVGSNSTSIAVCDLNGDGKQDIVAANSLLNNVSISLGNGVGGFGAITNVPVGSNPYFVTVADFNGDGKQDIATADRGSNTVSIRLGNGSGGLSGTTNVSVGSEPWSVVAGDFNGDSKLDLATTNFYSNSVSIRLGNGTGGFSGTTEVPAGTNPCHAALGDFNGDGKQDIAVTNLTTSSVSIRLGDGTGGFGGNTNVIVGSSPESVAVGDFNGDGKQDIAVANRFSNNVSIRLGDGAGNFSGTTNVPVGTYPISVAIGDFNGDGRQDIAAANQTGNNVSIRLGDGTGGFTGTTQVPVGVYPLKVAVGDFNTDGKQDIVTSNYFDPNSSSISIRFGAEGGTNTWLGLSNDWNSPSNWSAGMVPAACANVVVNTGVSYWPIVTGINNSCFALSVGNGATVIIAPAARLNITGK